SGRAIAQKALRQHAGGQRPRPPGRFAGRTRFVVGRNPLRITVARGLVVGMLVVGLWGCKKKHGKDGWLPVPDADAVTQVLKDFQMQDILNGTKSMMVEAPEGRILEKQRLADVDKPRISFYKNGKLSSTLNAPKGQVNMDTHAVLTWGGVTVVTPDSSTLT